MPPVELGGSVTQLNLGAEALDRHHPINHLKRITLRRNHREPLVRIKKTELTHPTHIPESYCDSQNRTNSGRLPFFEVPYRVFRPSTREICVCLLYTSPSPRDGLLSRM